MSAKASTIWLSIITNVLSYRNKYSYDRSIIPSAEEMGIETKTFHVNYGIENKNEDESLRRRMSGANLDYHDVSYNKSYQNIHTLTCNQTEQRPFRIKIDWTPMEFQEKQRFHADNPLDDLTGSQCSDHVKTVMGKAKQILSPVVNYFEDHMSIWPGPATEPLEMRYDWMESMKNWKIENNHYNGNHAESYQWSWWNMVQFYAQVATNPYTHGTFDLILYVINDDHYPCGKDEFGRETGVLAYATKIYVDQFGRPIGGIVNFCNFALQQVIDGHYMDAVNVLTHEVAHVLFMSDEHFPSFRLGNEINIAKVNNDTHWFLTTDNCAKVAQEFWNCPSALGCPIENQGGASTAFAHLEERFLLGELLTGIQYMDMQYASKFFWAMAADSGWYCPRIESGSSHFTMGKGYGCDWLEKPCIDDNGKSNFPQFFCDEDTGFGGSCTPDGFSIATCSTTTGSLKGSGRIGYKEAVVTYGHTVSWSGNSVNNRCPFYDAIENSNHTGPQLCMEDMGDLHARCIESDENHYKRKGQCYHIECIDWDVNNKYWNKLSITIDAGKIITCDKENDEEGKLKSQWGVTIKCPFIENYCPNEQPFACKFGSWDKKVQACVCFPGFAGTRCDEMDDCIVTYKQTDIDSLLDDQVSCSDLAKDGTGKKRETVVGMHHLYAQQHASNEPHIHLYPPQSAVSNIDVRTGSCNKGDQSLWGIITTLISAYPDTAQSIGIFSVAFIVLLYMYNSYCKK